MAEPTTALTDFALAAALLLLGERLLRSARPLPLSRRWWVAAFLSSALGAVLGGTRHALSPVSALALRDYLWSATYLVLGLANMALLAGAVRATLPRRYQAPAVGLLALRFLFYAVLLLRGREVRVVVVDFVLTLTLLLAFALLSLFARRDGTGPWLFGGTLISGAAAAVQAFRVAPLAGLSHNDVFHLIQMAGTWFFYRAGLRLTDR
jgi:hypothetical protein